MAITGIGNHSSFGFDYKTGTGDESTDVRLDQDTGSKTYTPSSNGTTNYNSYTTNAGTEEFDLYSSEPNSSIQSGPEVSTNGAAIPDQVGNTPSTTVDGTSQPTYSPENTTQVSNSQAGVQQQAQTQAQPGTNPGGNATTSSGGSQQGTMGGQQGYSGSQQGGQTPQTSSGAGTQSGTQSGMSGSTPNTGAGSQSGMPGSNPNAGAGNTGTTTPGMNGATGASTVPNQQGGTTGAVTAEGMQNQSALSDSQTPMYVYIDPDTNEQVFITAEEYNARLEAYEQQIEEFKQTLRNYGFNDYDIARIIDNNWGADEIQTLYENIINRVETDPNATTDRELYEAAMLNNISENLPEMNLPILTKEDFAFTKFSDFDAHITEVRDQTNAALEEEFLREIDEDTATYLLIREMAGNLENLEDARDNCIIGFRAVDEYGIVHYYYNPDGSAPIPDGMVWEYVRYSEFYGDSDSYHELEQLIPWRDEDYTTGILWWQEHHTRQVRTIDFSDPDVLAFYEKNMEAYANHPIVYWELDEENQALVDKTTVLCALQSQMNESIDYQFDHILPYITQPDFEEYSVFDPAQLDVIAEAEENIYFSYDGSSSYHYASTDEEKAAYLSCCFNNVGNIYSGYVYTNKGCYQVTDGDVFNHFISKWGNATDKDGNQILTQQEIQIFNYILKTEGATAALEYIDGIAEELDKRYLIAEQDKAREWAQASVINGILASIASVIITPFEGIAAFFNSIPAIKTDHIWRSDVISYGNIYRSAVSEAIRYKHDEDGKIMVDATGAYVANHPTLAFVYDTGMSLADTAAMIVVGYFTGGAGFWAELAVSTAMMGSRVYVSSLNDALDRGVSPRTAVLYSIGTSAIESLMEAYSLGHFLNLETKLGETTLNFVKNVGKKTGSEFLASNAYIIGCMISQAICEADEELCTEILDCIWDNVVCKDLSSFNLSVQGYMRAGEDQTKAVFHALADKAEDCFQAWLGGLASGLFFGGIKGIKISVKAGGAMNFVSERSGAVQSSGPSSVMAQALEQTNVPTGTITASNALVDPAIDYQQAQPGVQAPSASDAVPSQLAANNRVNISGLLSQYETSNQSRTEIFTSIIELFDSTSESGLSPAMLNTLINAGLCNISVANITSSEAMVSAIQKTIDTVKTSSDVIADVMENLQEAKMKDAGIIAVQLMGSVYNYFNNVGIENESMIQEFTNSIVKKALSYNEAFEGNSGMVVPLLSLYINAQSQIGNTSATQVNSSETSATTSAAVETAGSAVSETGATEQIAQNNAFLKEHKAEGLCQQMMQSFGIDYSLSFNIAQEALNNGTSIFENTKIAEMLNAQGLFETATTFQECFGLTDEGALKAISAFGQLTAEQMQKMKTIYSQMMEESNGVSLHDLAKAAAEPVVSENVKEIAKQLATDVRTTAEFAEPAITALMESLEGEGRYLIGLSHKLKGLDSLQRKIISDSVNDNISLQQAASKIGDSVRYTLICPQATLSTDVIDSVRTLVEQGYKILKFKNTFGSDQYNGINMSVLAPSGVKFELQFHTEQSFTTKEVLTHTLYEISRSQDSSKTMISLSNSLQEMAFGLIDTTEAMEKLKITDALGLSVEEYYKAMPDVYIKEQNIGGLINQIMKNFNTDYKASFMIAGQSIESGQSIFNNPAIQQILEAQGLTKTALTLQQCFGLTDEGTLKAIAAYGPLSDVALSEMLSLYSQMMQESNGVSLHDLAKKAADPDVSDNIMETANQLALAVRERAEAAEPAITALMRSLEGDGKYLTGLDFRLKGLTSLRRKIITDSINDNITLEQASNSIGDSVRYTLICPQATLSTDVIDSVRTLVEQGYKILKFKNTFGSNQYNGINMSVLSPSGVTFELQFHTEQSFTTKEVMTHTLYEISRSQDVSDNMKMLSNSLQERAFNLIETTEAMRNLKITNELGLTPEQYLQAMPNVYMKEQGYNDAFINDLMTSCGLSALDAVTLFESIKKYTTQTWSKSESKWVPGLLASAGMDLTATHVPISTLQRILSDEVTYQKFMNFSENFNEFGAREVDFPAYINAISNYVDILTKNGVTLTADVQARYEKILEMSPTLKSFVNTDIQNLSYVMRGQSIKVNIDSANVIFNQTEFKSFMDSLNGNSQTQIYYRTAQFVAILDYCTKQNIILSDSAIANLQTLVNMNRSTYMGFRKVLYQLGSYGANQHSIRNIADFVDVQGKKTNILSRLFGKKAIINEVLVNNNAFYDQLNNVVKSYFPDMSLSEINTLLKRIDVKGVCSYATVINEIFSYFSDNQAAFERTFGIPMYRQVEINGQIKTIFNDHILLADLFCFANKNNPNMIKKVGDNYVFGADDGKQIYMSGYSIGKNTDIIQAWLDSKNAGVTISSENYQSGIHITADNYQKYINLIKESLLEGKTVSMGVYTKNADIFEFAFYPTDFSENRMQSATELRDEETGKGGGHSIMVTGITRDGNLIVSTWGSEAVLRWQELLRADFNIVIDTMVSDEKIRSKIINSAVNSQLNIDLNSSYEQLCYQLFNEYGRDVITYLNKFNLNQQEAYRMIDVGSKYAEEVERQLVQKYTNFTQLFEKYPELYYSQEVQMMKNKRSTSTFNFDILNLCSQIRNYETKAIYNMINIGRFVNVDAQTFNAFVNDVMSGKIPNSIAVYQYIAYYATKYGYPQGYQAPIDSINALTRTQPLGVVNDDSSSIPAYNSTDYIKILAEKRDLGAEGFGKLLGVMNLTHLTGLEKEYIRYYMHIYPLDLNSPYQDKKVINDILLENQRNNSQVQQRILSKAMTQQDEIVRTRILYQELNKVLNYNLSYFKESNNQQSVIMSEHILASRLLQGDKVVCKGWSEAFRDLCLAAGLNATIVTTQKKGHYWVSVQLKDGRYILCDPTDAINNSIDLGNSKLGLPTNGFLIVDEANKYTRPITLYRNENNRDFLNYNAQQIRMVDILAGYATENGYMAEYLASANQLFDTTTGASQEISVFNLPIPPNTDGYEIYSYYKYVIKNNPNLMGNYSLNYKYFRTTQGISQINICQELTGQFRVQLYSEVHGKVLLRNMEEAEIFLRKIGAFD